MKQEFRMLSKYYNLCFLKLVIQRRFKLGNDLFPELPQMSLDLLEHHHLHNQPEIYMMGSDMDIQVSTIKVEPVVDSFVDFMFTTIIVIRKPLGELLKVELPKAPAVDDFQFLDYEFGGYDDTEGEIDHEAYWDYLKPDDFVNWLSVSGTSPVMISYRKHGLFESFIKNHRFARLSGRVISRDYISYEGLASYRCTEKEWNVFVVICLWKYYLGRSGTKLIGSTLLCANTEIPVDYLWDNYNEVVVYLQNSYSLFGSVPNLYDCTHPYVSQAKNLVLKYSYLM